MPSMGTHACKPSLGGHTGGYLDRGQSGLDSKDPVWVGEGRKERDQESYLDMGEHVFNWGAEGSVV